MEIVQDIRYGLRKIAAAKLVTLSASLILALGLGTNATTFALLNKVLWSAPPHVRNPDQLVLLDFQFRRFDGSEFFDSRVSYPLFEYLKTAVAAGVAVAAEARLGAEGIDFGFGRGMSSEQIRGVLVSTDYFRLLGVSPVLGRAFGSEDSRSPVVLLDHGFWRRKFGEDPLIIGKECWIGDKPRTIVGVLPSGFSGIHLKPVDVWLPVESSANDAFNYPFTVDLISETRMGWVEIISRIPSGKNRSHLEQSVSQILPSATTFFDRPVYGVRALPIDEVRMNRTKAKRLASWGAVVSFLILLVASANVANLMLLRNLYRAPEIAVRVQLGATVCHLTRQLLVECLLITLTAALLAVFLMSFGLPLFSRMVLGERFHVGDLFDFRVGSLLVGLSILATLMTGLLPALGSPHLDLATVFRSGRSEAVGSKNWLRTALVMAQVALAAILLAGAGLFWKSFENAIAVDLGFDARRTMTIELPGLGKLGYSNERIQGTFERFAEVARQVPGVESVALTSSLPFRSGMFQGVRLRNSQRWQGANFFAITPDYLRTMGMRLLRGRTFHVGDSESSAPVAIVNRSLANLGWQKQNPVGDCVYLGPNTPLCTEVVGVVEDSALGRFDERHSQIFIPLSQFRRYVEWARVGGMVVRLSQEGVRPVDLERALSSVPPQTYIRLSSLYSEVVPQFSTWERGRILFACLGGIALAVALIGYHAQLSQWTAARRREIGVRIALGATSRDITLLALRRGLWLAGGGLVLGLAGSVFVNRLMESLFYGVRSTDLFILVLIAALLLIVTLSLSIVSCWRAVKVPPMESLRYE